MKKIISVLTLSFISLTANASPHIIVAPTCLLNKTVVSHETLAMQQSFALIKTNDDGVSQLIEAKQSRTKDCGSFIDVSDAYEKSKLSANTFLQQYISVPVKFANENLDYKIQYPTQVNQLLSSLNPQAMWADLTTLSTFPDRDVRTENGLKAAEWIKLQVETLAQKAGRGDINTYFVKTGSYKQPSLVVKIGTSNEAGVVIGAHMDTVSSSFHDSPGADDDGSGSATILEAARTIINSGIHFKKPIYFVWYAGEEIGLVGSQYVVKDFQAKKIPVNAVLHFDLTGFAYKNEPTMWLIDDYVNKDLTTYLESLITTYVKKPVKHTRCGYACSDHATWTQNGFAAAIPAESKYENTNPSIHSAQDTMDKLSLSHMTDYAKLSTAFAVEMAEPV